MVDKLLAILFLLLLVVFMGIILVYINKLALWIIVCAVLVMAAYDFYVELRGSS